MADKSWKAFERRIAQRVGGRRIPVTGERDGADVVGGGPFVYQAKLRKGVPSYLRELGYRGIVEGGGALRRRYRCFRCGKQPNARDDDAVVVLRLRDWASLAWDVRPYKEKSPLACESGGPFDSVQR